ncbi:serine hydrolase [Sphingomicrobium sp. XHP0239]|uniref:serine hydrolase n=1 Tax=Sphingomicrobium maritimum TaxID=3133972 RepID=UPI0031CC59B2
MTKVVAKLALGGALIISSVASAQLIQDERVDVQPQPAPVRVDPTEADNDANIARPNVSSFEVTLPPRTTAQTPAHVAQLNAKILERVRSFNGASGIAVKSIDGDWEAGWQTERLFPQQSVSKLWVTMTMLDYVDRGQIDLNRRVTFGRDDVTLWSAATASKILAGGYSRTLDNLMFDALTKSDNHANDKILRTVGGPDAVRRLIRDKSLGAIRFGDGEREMQAQIAGLSWNQSYAYNNGFNRARSSLPASARQAAMDRYIENPYDGAAPMAIARALARLDRGELLSPASTAKFLTTMGLTSTGRLRVQGGLQRGWEWAHKTGTGQNFRGRVGGLNDVGILTAPDGSRYALAFMTCPNATDGSAQELMRDVTRMVIQHHEQYGRQTT